MLLELEDPFSILHTRLWGKSEQESNFIRTETLNVPAEDDLDCSTLTEHKVLDAGEDVTVFPNDKSRMLARKEYSAIWKLIREDRQTPGRQFGGTVVVGQPGIGEKFHDVGFHKSDIVTGNSFSVYYYLVMNLLVGQPTALQTDRNSFFLFVDTGVHLIRFKPTTPIFDIQSQVKRLGCKKGTIALVDSSDDNPSPAPVFTDGRYPFYVIQASSPVPARWNGWAKKRFPAIVVVHPWSWTETYIAGYVDNL